MCYRVTSASVLTNLTGCELFHTLGKFIIRLSCLPLGDGPLTRTIADRPGMLGLQITELSKAEMQETDSLKNASAQMQKKIIKRVVQITLGAILASGAPPWTKYPMKTVIATDANMAPSVI